MLSKRIELTIKDYTATLSSEIKFYKNDCLDLIFGIKEYGVKVRNGIAEANLMPINALNAKLLIETPSGVDSIEATSIEGNEITFRLTNTYTQYLGIFRMQIVLMDEDGCKVTTPEFKFEIKASINEEWDEGNSPVSYVTVLSNEEGKILTTSDGDIITVSK